MDERSESVLWLHLHLSVCLCGATGCNLGPIEAATFEVIIVFDDLRDADSYGITSLFRQNLFWIYCPGQLTGPPPFNSEHLRNTRTLVVIWASGVSFPTILTLIDNPNLETKPQSDGIWPVRLNRFRSRRSAASNPLFAWKRADKLMTRLPNEMPTSSAVSWVANCSQVKILN